jgi:hypothetical protein
MRKQKRYTSVVDIDAEIFKLRRLAFKLEHEAKLLDMQASNWIRIANESEGGKCRYAQEQANFDKKKSDKLRSRINSVNENRIPRLVRTRGALLTKPMGFMEDDGVTLQP